MRKSIQLVVFGTVLGAPGSGQGLHPGPASGPREEMLRREIVMREIDGQNREPEIQAAARREEQYGERQFMERANAFAQIWSDFAKEYNEKKTFNAKTARKMTRAFHKLEASKDWPRNSSVK